MTDLADAPALSPERAAAAAAVITRLAGPDASLRADQEQAVAALCEPGARVLVVQATGWGKSAVYWAATRIRRDEGAGLTLVVSPLLGLMRDQVRAATLAGLRAATVNSTNFEDWGGIEAAVRADEIDVLLVSPERLANPTFADRVLDALTGSLGLLVIDEAHSVSDWGHDFRPDYRRVADVLRQLNPDTPVLATTATANGRVVVDLAQQLGDQSTVIRGPLARRSLHLATLPAMDPLSRYAWLVQHLDALPGSGIVYCLTVADAERLAELLGTRHGADAVRAYTGRMGAEDRAETEELLRANKVKAVVATSALGMGFDKPDLGFVVHVGSPPTPVAYYQQVGRAGRGVDHALVVLLPATSDEAIWEHFATATIPVPAHVDKLLGVLDSADEPMSVPGLVAATGLRTGRVELMLKQLAVEEVTRRTTQGWESTGKAFSFDHARYESVLTQRRREADIMRAYQRGERCLMQLLAEALDDPAAAPCGNCSVCAGRLPEELAATADPAVVAWVRAQLRGAQVVLDARKMWPGGAWGSRSRIGSDEIVEQGRALVFADAPEWAQTVYAAFGPSAASEALDELAGAAVDCLTSWRASWSARPTLVVSFAAAGFGAAVNAVSARVAEVGRLPRAALQRGPAVPEGESSGGTEAVAWRESLRGGSNDGLGAAVAGQVVLLVVDRTSSGWPVTVAGAMLRRAGAAGVLPLVVHKLP